MLKENMYKTTAYTGVDIFKYIFACFIPMLHIALPGDFVPFIQQYISRLGVPFFFGVTGFLLALKINDENRNRIAVAYIKRIALLLFVWLIIYTPILPASCLSFKQIVFLTPAYLWYLTATLIAVIPFCLMKNRRVLYIMAFILYISGVLLGGAYVWLWGGCKTFEELFITSRNGLMFALPIMCAGEIASQISLTKKMHAFFLIITIVLLFGEITFVGWHVDANVDRSMYFTLPLFCVFFLSLISKWNPHIKSIYLRKSSSAIYLMQYGFIVIFTKFFSVLELGGQSKWMILGAVIIIPTILCFTFRNCKLIKYIC